MVKSAVFDIEKPLEMGPDLQKFQKKKFFEGEKSLDVGRDFRPLAAHPRQKIIWVPPRDTIIVHVEIGWSRLAGEIQIHITFFG